MAGSGHMSVRRGKRVIVYLRSGESYTARFLEKQSKVIRFYDHDDEKTANVKTITIMKRAM